MSPSRSITGPIAAALFAAVVVPAAALAQPAALSGGSVLIGGEAGFDVQSNSDADEDLTSFVRLF